jgi:hypothetical protein
MLCSLPSMRAASVPAAVSTKSPWPKTVPQLTAEQERIRDDFMRHWHEVLPRRYSLLERFNHRYTARGGLAGTKTLEIGAGLGEHLAFEQYQDENYWAVELRGDMAEAIRSCEGCSRRRDVSLS